MTTLLTTALDLLRCLVPLAFSPHDLQARSLSKMVKKKDSESKGEKNTSFTFPLLHQDIVAAVSDRIDSAQFCDKSHDEGCNNEFRTHVMGKFRCINDDCPTGGWGSKSVDILIKGYAENGYNAEVFNQRCKTCSQLGTLTLDEQSYVERVAYIIQQWAGSHMEQESTTTKGGMPHEKKFCEGCKRGICRQVKD